MSRISKGVMSVEVNGQEYTLKATIAAIESIEQRFQGGLVSAAQACMKLSFTDATFILSKAANLNKEQTKELKNNIVAEGIESATTYAAEYISMLINPEGQETEEDDEPGEE